MVPTQRLEYLIAVAREGSFTRAAQVLHVAQPALSRQVGLLERQLGVQLLARTPQGIRPTAAGAVLIDRAEGLLGELERAFDDAAAVGRGERGSVTLAYTASASHDTAPVLAAALRDALPAVSVRTIALPRADLLAGLAAGTLDAGIVRCPPPRTDLTVTTLRDEPQGVLARGDHQVFAHTEPLTLGHALRFPLLLHDRAANPEHWDAVMRWCAAAGIEPQIRPRLISFDVSYSELLAGDAVAIVGAMAAGLPAGLTWRPLTPPLTVPIGLITRDPEDPAIARVRGVAEATARASRWLSHRTKRRLDEVGA